MNTIATYSIDSSRGDAQSIDIFGSNSDAYCVQHLTALPVAERSRLAGPALAALALILAGLPVLTLVLEKLA
ncbi:MAG: hypothetical protein RLZZ555_458 [Pseudomonadota bacterium]|jgi:hypothetical protein